MFFKGNIPYRSIDWLIDWLIDLLIDWLMNWLVVRLMNWLVVRLIDWFAHRLIDWFLHRWSTYFRTRRVRWRRIRWFSASAASAEWSTAIPTPRRRTTLTPRWHRIYGSIPRRPPSSTTFCWPFRCAIPSWRSPIPTSPISPSTSRHPPTKVLSSRRPHLSIIPFWNAMSITSSCGPGVARIIAAANQSMGRFLN